MEQANVIERLGDFTEEEFFALPLKLQNTINRRELAYQGIPFMEHLTDYERYATYYYLARGNEEMAREFMRRAYPDWEKSTVNS